VRKISQSQSPTDQAQELRRIVEGTKRDLFDFGHMRTLTVLSGKGGVGKSNLSVNLACALNSLSKRVVLLDADLGMANVDLLCGVVPKFTLLNLVQGNKTVEEVLLQTPQGIRILPGGSGVRELADITEIQLESLLEALSILENSSDYLIVDTGAGISKGVLAFATAADTILLITTPEPTSIRDAYGVLKALNFPSDGVDIQLVVNMVQNPREGKEVAARISNAATRFLGLTVSYLGSIAWDEQVGKAIHMRKPFFEAFPECAASSDIRAICSGIESGSTHFPPPKASVARGIKHFFIRLIRGLKRRDE
jgi:flagellar biosynthesis protein FlhG